MAIQAFTVLLNALLAPILIAGWGTGLALGVAGAGLASTVSIVIGVVLLGLYFVKLEKYVSFRRDLWRPQFHVWKRMLDVGLPAGGEFALMFIYMGVIYWVISAFGAAAQAGFGIGSRIMQSIFMPGNGDRVRRGADRRSELRRGPRRARARDVREGRDAEHGRDGARDGVPAVAARGARRLLHARERRDARSARRSCARSRGPSSRRASCSRARVCSKGSATRSPRC